MRAYGQQCEWREYNVLHQHSIINDDDDDNGEATKSIDSSSTRLWHWGNYERINCDIDGFFFGMCFHADACVLFFRNARRD